MSAAGGYPGGMERTSLAAVLGCCAALSACATPKTGGSVRLSVPHVRQAGTHSGGLASAQMVARYYKSPLSPRVERLMRLASTSGDLSGGELRSSLESSGYRVSVFTGRLGHGASGLYSHLDRGEPVIVMLGSSYMIVDGYDGESLWFIDPRHGSVRTTAADFDLAWQDSRRFALVAQR